MHLFDLAVRPRRRLAAAAVLFLSLTWAGAAGADTSQCGPIPQALPPLPSDTVLVWSTDATGACVAVTQEYQCAQATGQPC